MKIFGITSTAILSLLFGIAAPAYAQHEQQGEKQDHPQQQRSKHEQLKPEQQHAQQQRQPEQKHQQSQRAQQQQRQDQNEQQQSKREAKHEQQHAHAHAAVAGVVEGASGFLGDAAARLEERSEE